MHRFLAVFFFWVLSLSVCAHEMRPAIATFQFGEDILSLQLEVNLEAWMAGIDPGLTDTDDSLNAPMYDQLRALSSEELGQAFAVRYSDFVKAIKVSAMEQSLLITIDDLEVLPADDDKLSRISLVNLSVDLPVGATNFVYEVDLSMPNTAVRLFLADADPRVEFVKTGEATGPISLDSAVSRSFLTIVLEYMELGFAHILPKGLDHIVFILGLTLISKRAVDLLVQVTAFTIAHSVTLALGLYGVINLPASIVEPLIAASIIYVAVENCWHERVAAQRTLVIFLFGLLHGLGFAGVLIELGLPQRDFLVGLLSFNIGVEFGQLVVIAVAYLVVGIWVLNKSWYRIRVAIPASILIGLIGTFWFVERVAW
jgi:hypothetical protein